MVESGLHPLLKISNPNDIKKFLHECIDDLIKKHDISFDNYNSGPIEWTKDDFEKAKRSVQSFYKQCAIENKFQLNSQNLEENIYEALESCYIIRKKDIFQHLAKSYILKNGHNLIENIDWKLKWVLGSSDLTVIKEPYLQIDLNGIELCSGEIKTTCLSFEANLEQVDQFIKELTNIKADLNAK
ncbi:uncharacterized protein [Diabrotica undecimpunctata]|uniref:uncharacterized protein n=1 Tax=Diabrotica undecimpunctata TaxID=50387 RepID=UPI003B63F8EB